MKKRKLNYRFHNPNSAKVTAHSLLEVFIEANLKKVEKAIQETVEQVHNNKESDEGHSA